MRVCVVGRVSALAVSVSGNFKQQQSHRVFVLYGFSMCGDKSRSFGGKWWESPSGVKETLLGVSQKSKIFNTWTTEEGERRRRRKKKAALALPSHCVLAAGEVGSFQL